jgi:hypothetical protein
MDLPKGAEMSADLYRETDGGPEIHFWEEVPPPDLAAKAADGFPDFGFGP